MNAARARALAIARFACLNLGAALLLLAALELAARALQLAAGPPAAARGVPHAILSRQEWGPRYLEDVAAYGWQVEYAPYVEFRARPFASETINVDADGRRRHGEPSPGEDAPRVFLYGGSTMFGVGAPDGGTIAACLARRVGSFAVENHSTTWWTSSQSAADLELSLRAGRRPAVAIFYDGINDIDVVTFGGRPGGIAPQAETMLSRGLSPEAAEPPSLLEALAARLELVRALGGSRWLRSLRGDAPRTRATADEAARREALRATRLSDLDREYAARRVADVYAENVRMLTALASEYGFESHFFLQPFPLISEKPLSEIERQALALRRGGWEPEFARRVYAHIRASAYLAAHPHFHDLSGAFDAERGELFVDDEHLLPAGNEIVARLLVEGVAALRGAQR